MDTKETRDTRDTRDTRYTRDTGIEEIYQGYQGYHGENRDNRIQNKTLAIVLSVCYNVEIKLTELLIIFSDVTVIQTDNSKPSIRTSKINTNSLYREDDTVRNILFPIVFFVF